MESVSNTEVIVFKNLLEEYTTAPFNIKITDIGQAVIFENRQGIFANSKAEVVTNRVCWNPYTDDVCRNILKKNIKFNLMNLETKR